jgi:pentatricopeptide repeat protein
VWDSQNAYGLFHHNQPRRQNTYPPTPTHPHTQYQKKGHVFPSPDAHEAATALMALTVGDNRADWAAGLSLLSSLPAQFDVTPTLDAHALVLRALADAGRGVEAYGVIQRMRAMGVAPDVRCLNSALRACGRMRMAREARELMGWLEGASGGVGKGGGLAPGAFVSAGLGGGEAAGEEGERGVGRSSAFTYSLAIDAAAKAGDADRAAGLLGEMKVGERRRREDGGGRW